MHHLNTYQCIGSPTVKNTLTIDQWLSQIKNSDFSSIISQARLYKQFYYTTKNEVIKDEYDKIKYQLPTITYNSTFSGYRSTANYVSSTGLMYIDIDVTEFDITTLDTTKVFAYYKSIGGLGYSILVKVDNLNPDNYLSTFTSITKELGIDGVVDTDAKGMMQQTVISADPDIFINKNSYVFKPTKNDEIKKDPRPLKESIEEKHIGGVGSFSKTLRYNNINDFNIEGDYIENWNEGFNFIRCYLPAKKLKDKRKRTILSYLTNLIYLNPSIEYYHAVNILENINRWICIVPLKKEILTSMLKSILKQKNEGKLIPHYTRRRIIFKTDSGLDVEDKLDITSSLLKEKFGRESKARIYDIIENWNFDLNGKVTQIAITKFNINIKTVKKYWFEFKDLVKSLNDEFRRD